MLNRFKSGAILILMMAITFGAHGAAVIAAHPNGVVWEGDKGPGLGKHIVFISGDHEYRGE